ncbi:MAG: hypothetical protein KDI08_08790 [Pseudomonadales bacterium]|nr:hypothetical protein [Pseudomonadales bacterium]
MRSIFTTAIVLVLGGCATMDSPPGESSAASTTTGATPLEVALDKLEQAAGSGTPVVIALSDGFGSQGARVVRSYFSASGKRCSVAVDAATGQPRTFCRDGEGTVNAFGSGIPRPR